MSKSVWFKIHFTSRKGTHYEIEIVKDGNNPHGEETLQCGETPFVTDEDDSEDMFEPVRVQTGTLQIIYQQSVAYPNIADFLTTIMPTDNIQSLVRLVNSDTGETEWMGFLNCESYSQDYTSIAQSISMSVNGVLQAMENIEIDGQYIYGIRSIKDVICFVLNLVAEKTGLQYLYDYFYIPTEANGANILDKFINTSILFQESAITNENETSYIVSGISCRDALERIATYMGWVVREQGRRIYFMCSDENSKYIRYKRTSAAGILSDWQYNQRQDVINTSMSDFTYAGTGHQVSKRMGARSVAVIAKIAKTDFNLNLPECPDGELSVSYRDIERYGDYHHIWIWLNTNPNSYSNLAYAYYYGYYAGIGDSGYIYGQTSMDEVANHLVLRNQGINFNNADKYAGAFLTKFAHSTDTTPNPSNALLCSFIPGIDNGGSVIFSMVSNKGCVARQGDYLRLTVKKIDAGSAWKWQNGPGWLNDGNYINEAGNPLHHLSYIKLMLNFAGKYWNPSAFAWVSYESTIEMNAHGDVQLDIPIPQTMEGRVTLSILGGERVNMAISPHEMIPYYIAQEIAFTELSVTQIVYQSSTASDRSQNEYRQLLGLNFSDDITIDTELASDLNNQISPSLIIDNDGTFMKELNYSPDGSLASLAKPERVLLDRIAKFYSRISTMLNLEIEKLQTKHVPTMRILGYDGNTYIPMSVSRDWKEEIDTITCIDTPTAAIGAQGAPGVRPTNGINDYVAEPPRIHKVTE